MDTSEPSPFEAHADGQHNACVDNFMQFVELANCYVRSADILVSSTIEDRSMLDVHIYAICFLYRHALELILKDLAWKSHYAETGIKRFTQDDWKELGRHRLQDLWQTMSANGRRLLGVDFPLSTREACQVGDLFAQFEQHDPDSFAFRYPISKNKKGRTHPSLRHVNVRVLHEKVRHVFDLLGRLCELIGYLCEQQSESER
jgi:hypothetical protein